MGRSRKDMTGKFGLLTVLHFDQMKYGKAYWLCQCECGKIKSIEGTSLRIGESVSCGCHIVKPVKMKVGEKFNSLTILSLHSRKIVRWKCICDCGNIVIVRGDSLKKTKSCGCTKVGRPRISL